MINIRRKTKIILARIKPKENNTKEGKTNKALINSNKTNQPLFTTVTPIIVGYNPCFRDKSPQFSVSWYHSNNSGDYYSVTNQKHNIYKPIKL